MGFFLHPLEPWINRWTLNLTFSFHRVTWRKIWQTNLVQHSYFIFTLARCIEVCFGTVHLVYSSKQTNPTYTSETHLTTSHSHSLFCVASYVVTRTMNSNIDSTDHSQDQSRKRNLPDADDSPAPNFHIDSSDHNQDQSKKRKQPNDEDSPSLESPCSNMNPRRCLFFPLFFWVDTSWILHLLHFFI